MAETEAQTFTKDQRLEMIYLRSFLNKVEKEFQEKDLSAQRIRYSSLFN